MDGLITVRSDYSVKETADKIASFAEANGLTIFLRLDHAANAEQLGLELRPTELLVFGNPKAGTVLMQDKQISGIDLPWKALAWQDASGAVWLTYNDANWIFERHGLGEASSPIVQRIEQGMTQAVKVLQDG